MAAPVVNGTFIKCSCASAQTPGTPIPGELAANANMLPPAVPMSNSISVISSKFVKCGNNDVATIQDNKSMVNIKPFQNSCKSASNTANISASKAATASATASAGGTYTPMTVLMPCLPAITGPWAPGCSTVSIGGVPALNNTSKLMCMHGGVIEIEPTNPPSTVKIP